jgi:hypothetical protein
VGRCCICLVFVVFVSVMNTRGKSSRGMEAGEAPGVVAEDGETVQEQKRRRKAQLEVDWA